MTPFDISAATQETPLMEWCDLVLMKIFGLCALVGTGSAVVAQVVPTTAGSPWAITVAASIGVVGTAIVHFYNQLSKAKVLADAARLDANLKYYRDQNETLEQRAVDAEVRAAQWKLKYEMLSATVAVVKPTTGPSSPPGSGS